MKISKAVLACGAAALCVVSTSVFATDTEQEARIREALRQRMNELGPETSAETAKPAKATTKQSAPTASTAPAASAPVVTPAPVVAPARPATAVSDEAQAERLREALRARLQQEQSNPTPSETVVSQGSDLEPAVSTTKAVSPLAPTSKPEVKPMPSAFEAPVSPLPASKEERLARLLQQYKADLITPEQYHLERAKIVAE